MADLILHHYPTSPFAEKVRLALAYKKLAWKSVIIPMIMPKPEHPSCKSAQTFIATLP
jgi:glutathione S-transferase